MARRKPKPSGLKPGDKAAPATQKLDQVKIKALHATAKEIGMSHEQLHELAAAEYKVSSITELSREQADSLHEQLKEMREAAGA